ASNIYVFFLLFFLLGWPSFLLNIKPHLKRKSLYFYYSSIIIGRKRNKAKAAAFRALLNIAIFVHLYY
ncbi:hypothetical protein ACJX0J_019461, partial [Zea mays]